MRKLLSLLLILSLLTTVSIRTGKAIAEPPSDNPPSAIAWQQEPIAVSDMRLPDRNGLTGLTDVQYTDPNFSTLAENELYLDLSELLYDSGYEDATVHVNVAYYSKEYIEELTYNSRENIYYGYRLSELEAMFVGTRYVFTCDDQGMTTVQTFEAYDDTYDRVLQNIAIGTGIIVVCVTITLATGGFVAPAAATATSAINIAFRSAATASTLSALSGGGLAALMEANAVATQTGNWEEAKKAAALAGSEGYKWGAVIGAGTGMVSGVVQYGKLLKALKAPKTPIEAILAHTPVDGNTGKWVDGTRGNGKFVPTDPEVKALLAKNGLDGITYRDGVPDFSPFTEAKVEITGKYLNLLNNPDSTHVRRAMQREAKEILAKQRGVLVDDINMWMRDNNITIHEDINMSTLSFVPRTINGSFLHLGGVSEYMTRLAYGL